ncbi:hypothetical protein I4U23_006377 [Adineta vaga]|nr:hypothetical protein I4U23_006377 [Adineta vaga]
MLVVYTSYLFSLSNSTIIIMLYEKRHVFGIFSPWNFTSENHQLPMLIYLFLIIFLALIIALICEHFEELFCCHQSSHPSLQNDHEITQMLSYIFCIIYFYTFYIQIITSTKIYKFERSFGSNVILPSCLSVNNVTTILFKSDSGELLSLNGLLISDNPRLIINNQSSTEFVIQSLELSDQGEYECRTDEILIYILHLLVVNLSIIHLTVREGSNVTLQCVENGRWIIEESHRGGPVRTQYTSELILNNIQRNDHPFQKITCLSLNKHDRREYIIDVMYKPTVKLVMSERERLICIICAQPIPYRIQWSRNARKERDENIHQTNINQSCIVQQFTSILKQTYDREQIIECEAENIYGIDRDRLRFNGKSIERNLTYRTRHNLSITSSNTLTKLVNVTNKSSCFYSNRNIIFTGHFMMILFLFKNTVIVK